MLYRRVIQHVTDQNWSTVILEAALIVAGVVIALEAQKWADDQEDLELYREALNNVRSEIDANLERIDERIGRTEALDDADTEAARALLDCDTSPEARNLINRGLLLFLVDVSPSQRLDSLVAIQQNPRFNPLIPGPLNLEIQRLRAFSELLKANAEGNKNIITYFATTSPYVRISYEANPQVGLPVLVKPVSEVCKDNVFTGKFWLNALVHEDTARTSEILKERFIAFKKLIDDEYIRVGGSL